MNKSIEPSTRVFELGRIVIAPHATKFFEVAGFRILDDLLASHTLLYWGKASEGAASANDRAIARGRGEVSSRYDLDSRELVFVDTNEDWSETIIRIVEDCFDSFYSIES